MLIHSPGNQTLYLSISARGYDPLLFARAFNVHMKTETITVYCVPSGVGLPRLLTNLAHVTSICVK